MDVGDGVDIMGGSGPLDASALMPLEGKQYDHELAPHSSSERFVLFSLSIDPLHLSSQPITLSHIVSTRAAKLKSRFQDSKTY